MVVGFLSKPLLLHAGFYCTCSYQTSLLLAFPQLHANGICFHNFTAKGRQSSHMPCYSYGLSILALRECKAEVDLF